MVRDKLLGSRDPTPPKRLSDWTTLNVEFKG